MTILVTGMTSRTASPRSQPNVFSAALAKVLHADRAISRLHGDLSKYEGVIVGLGSPLSPSANHTFGALDALMSAIEQEKLLGVFIDDSNIEQFQHGISSTLRDPNRLRRAFFSKRVGYNAVVADLDVFDRMVTALRWLDEADWPPLLWPSHPWGDVSEYRIRSAFPRAKQVVGLDMTSEVWSQPALVGTVVPRQKRWLHETRHAPKYVGLDALDFEADDVRAKSTTLNEWSCWGILEGQNPVPGWWTPTPAFAASALALYATTGVNGTALNRVTAHTLETLHPNDRDRAALEQRTLIEEVSWTRTQLSARTHGALGLTIS